MIQNTKKPINRFNASLIFHFFQNIGEDLIEYSDIVNFLYEQKKIVSKNDLVATRNVVYMMLHDFAIHFGFELQFQPNLHQLVLDNHAKRERITILTPDV